MFGSSFFFWFFNIMLGNTCYQCLITIYIHRLEKCIGHHCCKLGSCFLIILMSWHFSCHWLFLRHMSSDLVTRLVNLCRMKLKIRVTFDGWFCYIFLYLAHSHSPFCVYKARKPIDISIDWNENDRTTLVSES